MQKSTSQLSFSDITVGSRKIKSQFFVQIDKIIDWQKVDTEIKKYYHKGFSVDGRPSYSGLVLFKMTLLQTWYNLSDYEVEAQVNDSLSFMQFTGLRLADSVPDHSIVSKFRTALTKLGAYEKIFDSINAQLEVHHILVKSGSIVDASVTATPRKPKGKKEYEIVTDRAEEQTEATSTKISSTVAVKVQPGVDPEGAWLKKAGKLHYGYKRHTSVDENEGLVTSVITTAANESDMHHIEDVIEKANYKKGSRVKADKGYQSESNTTELKRKGYRPQIMLKALRNKGLTERQKRYNQLISKTRYKVERTFAGMARWFGAGTARYIGLAKTHTQHLMEAIAYNLYRSPAIAMRTQIKQTQKALNQ
jgi:IS5 family transposase